MRKKIKIIAEVGINHNGNIKIAKKLIDYSKSCGSDFVKFQSFDVDKLILRNEKKMAYQVINDKKKESQYEMLKKCQLDQNDHIELINYCKSKDIKFLSTPYDIESAILLRKLGQKLIKVASTDATNLFFLNQLLDLDFRIILSLGATSHRELLKLFCDVKVKKKLKNITLLHCVSFYPANIFDLNLSVIRSLEEEFKLKVGISDHTNNLNVGMYATLAGAQIIEKHITLDRTLPGPDHKASLEPKQFKIYVKNIRLAEELLGEAKKKVVYQERIVKRQMQRSIYTLKKINKNEKITMRNIITMRPADGISPLYYKKVINKKAKRNLEINYKLKWSDLK